MEIKKYTLEIKCTDNDILDLFSNVTEEDRRRYFQILDAIVFGLDTDENP